MLCPGVPSWRNSSYFSFHSCLVTRHLWLYVISLIRSEERNRGKRGSVNNLWVLPPWNWGIMIRILVPLLCHSVPVVKVGYATEQAKQLFWAERLCFPQKHGGDALSPGQKKTIKRHKKGPGVQKSWQPLLNRRYWRRQLFTCNWRGHWVHIHPFSVYSGPGLSGSRFSKVASRSSSSFWGIPRGSQTRQDM